MWTDENNLANAVIVYGVVYAQNDHVEMQFPDSTVVTPEHRDQWWKWALGAGIVSAGAYLIYQRYH